MKGVLVIAHGSRAKETEQALQATIMLASQQVPDVALERAFMEFSEDTVEKGVGQLVAKGATHIKVVPYFLFMGMHMRHDIPDMLAQCEKAYPGVTITMGEPLGFDPRLAGILADRIRD